MFTRRYFCLLLLMSLFYSGGMALLAGVHTWGSEIAGLRCVLR